MLNTYVDMFPIWMKDDPKFTKIYQYIEGIFNQVVQTCEAMKENLVFDIKSKEFLKVLSIFGQEEVFRTAGTTGTRVIGLEWDETNSKWIVKRSESLEDFTIVLSEFSLYFSAKFNSLKNNFDGTFKSLRESLEQVFKQDTEKGDYISVKGYQEIRKDDYNNDKPFILLNLDLSDELQGQFPLEEAYDPDHLWDINYIDPDWISASEENTEKYNTYKDYLELLTLFENDYFKLNILGVLTKFEVTGNALVLRWNEGLWNEATWSNNYVQEEE